MLHSWTARIALCIVIGGLASAAVRAQVEPPVAVAVLPFVNISGVPDDDWIGAGMAETVTAELHGRATLTPIGRETVHEAALAVAVAGGTPDSNADFVEVGRAVGARLVAGGGYQRVGERMRITARLVDVRNGAAVGATVVDGPVAELFALQDRVAAELLAFADANNGQGFAAEPVAPRPAEAAASPSAGVAGFETARVAPGFIDGPPPPLPPDVIRRDEARRATIRAVEVDDSIRLDGQLDERVYYTVPAITGFIQQAPD